MKYSIGVLLSILMGLWLVSAVLAEGDENYLTVTGLVKQPAVYSSRDLRDLKTIYAHYYEIGLRSRASLATPCP